jgi:hypothetical protein
MKRPERKLISIALIVAAMVLFARGASTHAADSSVVELVGVALEPLAGSTVEVIRQSDGQSFKTSADDTDWFRLRVAVPPGEYQMKLGTESCDSNGKTYPFESYGGRTQVRCAALCGAPMHCWSSFPGVSEAPGISGFLAGPAAGVSITVRDNSDRVIGKTSTNAEGRYSVGGLRAGEQYSVTASTSDPSMKVHVPTWRFAPEPRTLNFQLNPKDRFVEDQWLHASPGYLELIATVDKLEGTHPVAPAHATADLTGTVVAPLVGARVSIEDRAGKTVARTVSDGEGYYCLLLHDITSGFYTFTMDSAQISSRPVVSKNWWLNPWTDELSDLRYSPTGPPTGVTGGWSRRSGAPPRPPQIYGTLLGPVKGALVTLKDHEGRIREQTHTDASGNYQFRSLPLNREFIVSTSVGEPPVRYQTQRVSLIPYILNFEVDKKDNAMRLCDLPGCPGF